VQFLRVNEILQSGNYRLSTHIKELKMPIRKNRLNADEKEQYLSYLKQLHAEGVAISIPEDLPERCPLEISQGRCIGGICDLPGFNTLYAIPLRLIARSPAILLDHRIQSLWDDSIEFPFLSERNKRYYFGSLSYLSSEVLNDHFDEPFSLSRGAIVDGVIIAYGCVPVPEEFAGRSVPVQITLTDTLNREIRSEITLTVEPLSKRKGSPFRVNRESPLRAQKHHETVPPRVSTGGTPMTPAVVNFSSREMPMTREANPTAHRVNPCTSKK
jgi:hypothetical protein